MTQSCSNFLDGVHGVVRGEGFSYFWQSFLKSFEDPPVLIYEQVKLDNKNQVRLG
jgi:hypothetical protein